MENAESLLLDALISASHELTLPEKRLLALALNEIGGRVVNSFRVTGPEFMEAITGRIEDSAYYLLKRASMDLYNRSINVLDSDSNASEICLRWLERCQYNQDEGWVELVWDPELFPSLYSLRRHLSKDAR
jgi:plasmid replication initiation protein